MTTVQDTAGTADLANRVYRMMRDYLVDATERRTGMKLDELRKAGQERGPEAERFRDRWESICEDAFLQMRSRRSKEEFVAYFAENVGRAPHRLQQRDFADLSVKLMDGDDGWEQVKALAMLALSAHLHFIPGLRGPEREGRADD